MKGWKLIVVVSVLGKWNLIRHKNRSTFKTSFYSKKIIFLQVAAVFAADAVARMTGRIGVVAVTAGPGLTNTITAVKNAQMAESPLLLIGNISLKI